MEVMGIKILVPKKGLEPPHPCGYMDLNHARLPIPPLRRVVTQPPERAALPATIFYLLMPSRCCQTRMHALVALALISAQRTISSIAREP